MAAAELGPEASADAALIERLRAMCVEAGLARFEREIGALLGRRGAADVLPGIACPTLVATGAADLWSPPAQHAAIAAAIPGARFAVVERAGHMLPAEAPDALNQLIAAWLDEPGAAAA